MKKSKILLMFVIFMMLILNTQNIFASSKINYNKLNYGKAQYKIIIDGQTYSVPDKITYSDGYVLDLSTFKDRLKTQAENVSVLDYNDGKLSYKGGLFNSTVTNEYNTFFNSNGLMNPNLTETLVKNGFEKFQLLPIRENSKAEYEQKIKDENPTGDDLYNYNFRIKTYSEDIDNFNKINIDGSKKVLFATLPYLGEDAKIKDNISFENKRISSITLNIELDYRVYSMIFRDLRVKSIKYSIDGQEYTAVPSFDINTYTYKVKLPDTVSDNAVITTKSEGYMEALNKNSKETSNIDSGIKIQDSTIKLSNGSGVATVKSIFDIKGTYGSFIDPSYTTNPEKTYRISFYKYDNFLKGDLDRNGIVDSNDASTALLLYKQGNWNDDDIKYGDMDNNGVIDSNDASLILELYKSL